MDISEFTSKEIRSIADEASDGSDSEPSVDCVPTEKMVKMIRKQHTDGNLEAARIANSLKAAEIKSRRKEIVMAKRAAIVEKQKLAQQQKAELIRLHEEQKAFEAAQKKKTFANTTPHPGQIASRR